MQGSKEGGDGRQRKGGCGKEMGSEVEKEGSRTFFLGEKEGGGRGKGGGREAEVGVDKVNAARKDEALEVCMSNSMVCGQHECR